MGGCEKCHLALTCMGRKPFPPSSRYELTAVASTEVLLTETTTAPVANLASWPVSNLKVNPPDSPVVLNTSPTAVPPPE